MGVDEESDVGMQLPFDRKIHKLEPRERYVLIRGDLLGKRWNPIRYGAESCHLPLHVVI